MRGRLFVWLQRVLPKRLITGVAGRLAVSRWRPLRRLLIRLFIRRYGVDLGEAARTHPDQYQSFNDFFTRDLKPGARPLAGAAGDCISPADGILSQIGTLDGDRLVQAKGIEYSLPTLLAGDGEMVARYRNGLFATIYLSPRDYHRVHMPLTGRLRRSIFVPGRLFSVNATTTAHLPDLFARNERWIGEFDGEQTPFCVVLVGAMVVASIRLGWEQRPMRSRQVLRSTFDPATTSLLQRGAELARFELGSTAIVLAPEGSQRWAPGLKEGSAIRMGQLLGTAGESA